MKYQIISTTEAHKTVEKDKKNLYPRVEEITSCAVYKLTSGEAILVPFDSSTSAIFYSLEECMEFIQSDKIDEIRTGNRFEYIKNDMLKIEESWHFYISKLAEILTREIRVTNEKAYLKKLNKDILRYGKRNAQKDLYVEIGIYLCAVLKEIVNGKWIIRESNQGTKYNFFKPYILDEDNITYSAWKPMAESFYENRKFDIVDFLSRASIYWNIDISGDRIVKK